MKVIYFLILHSQMHSKSIYLYCIIFEMLVDNVPYTFSFAHTIIQHMEGSRGVFFGRNPPLFSPIVWTYTSKLRLPHYKK